MADEKKGFLQEFKEFALKGNVMDMAIGVIIGGAFGNIVTALTTSFINPLIGLITGGAQRDENGQIVVSAGSWSPVDGVEFTYGAFISAVVNFLILALILFCLLKAINKASNAAEAAAKKLKKEEEEKAAAEAAAPEPSKEEVLLTEIRDLLKNK
ncbi:MAG: large conductance mechanosensitive channel protein MscL [Oscillospiraceae bacterium]|nr:large conductance mechanosensitive channel protein MscL [Oscillospiraceae bacterium]